MDTLEAIFTRRSRREFSSDPVSAQQMEAIVKAGMHAPSSNNCRAWSMITVTDRKVLNAMADAAQWWKMLKQAPLAIVTVADFSGLDEAAQQYNEEYRIQNCAAATENMLLCAHALGLGGVWLGICPEREHYEPVKQLLGLPEQMRPVSVIAVGHPTGEPRPRTEPFELEKWHKEVW